MATTRKYDLYSSDFRETTHETYARMRRDDPVHRQPGLDGETPIWFVTRYEDVVAVLLDDTRFVVDPALALTAEELESRQAELGSLGDERVSENLLTKDGDDHRRLRRLVTKAFTPRMVEQLRPRIQEIADDLLDATASRASMDLVDDYAFPLPITVIAELLGIPSEDRDRFRRWSNTFVLPALTPELQEQFRVHTDEFVAYLDELFAARRAAPQDDLLSALVQAEEAGDHLSQNELYSMAVLLIVAGHETTVSLITNAALALLTHPQELGRLRSDPALLDSAVDELLRFDSPVERGITRWAATDVELGGKTISRGDLVIPVVGSANRDAERFPNADVLDLGREDVKHVGFGRGSHYCLGAPLAKVEAEIALRTLFTRLPTLRLAIAEDDLYWRPIPIFRALASLPVAWDSSRAPTVRSRATRSRR
jgi:cytochrome P450